jgi:hypothetical protein
MSGYGVFELSMTAALCNLVPAVFVDQAQDVSRLHSSQTLVYRSVLNAASMKMNRCPGSLWKRCGDESMEIG